MSGVGRLGVLIPAKKCSTCKVIKLGKKISSAICCKLFSERNDFVLSNDEYSILKASLVGFRTLWTPSPCSKISFPTMSFIKSATSFRIFKPSSKLDCTFLSPSFSNTGSLKTHPSHLSPTLTSQTNII